MPGLEKHEKQPDQLNYLLLTRPFYSGKRLGVLLCDDPATMSRNYRNLNLPEVEAVFVVEISLQQSFQRGQNFIHCILPGPPPREGFKFGSVIFVHSAKLGFHTNLL